MKILINFIFLMMLLLGNPVQAGPLLIGTYTGNADSLKSKIKLPGCNTTTVTALSLSIEFYEDNTFVENVNTPFGLNVQTGMWAFYTGDNRKIRFDYDGDSMTLTGIWGTYWNSIVNTANQNCNRMLVASGPTVRLKKHDMSIGTIDGNGNASAKTSFQVEGYGRDIGTGVYSKVVHTAGSSGVMVWAP